MKRLILKVVNSVYAVLIVLFLLMFILIGCTEEVDEINIIEPEKVEVRLEVDKFHSESIQISPMGRTAAAPYTHNISNRIATVTVASTDYKGNVNALKYKKELNKINELTLMLNVGYLHTIYIDPDSTFGGSYDTLVWRGRSEGFVATSDMNVVTIQAETDQALVLVLDSLIRENTLPTMYSYTDSTYTTQATPTRTLKKSGDYYRTYLQDMALFYKFVVHKEDNTTANIKVYNLKSGYQYTLILNIFDPEGTDGVIDVDLNGAFTNWDIII